MKEGDAKECQYEFPFFLFVACRGDQFPCLGCECGDDEGMGKDAERREHSRLYVSGVGGLGQGCVYT